jgi:hypothetical protein
VLINYARKLAQSKSELTLQEIILLDKVVKGVTLLNAEIKMLRDKGLIEGRKPNFHISSSIAESIGENKHFFNTTANSINHLGADKYHLKCVCHRRLLPMADLMTRHLLFV